MHTASRTSSSRTARRVSACCLATGAAVLSIALTGCGMGTLTNATAPITVQGVKLQGNVHGGQQPVTGSALQLYAVNTNGYGLKSYPMLNTAVSTDSAGNFTITGDYTCPSSTAEVYIVATGGNPGMSSVNPNLALLSALGPCGNLTPSTYITINELTTVAGVYALSPFMTDYTAISVSSSNVTGLTNAFSTVNKLVNGGSGSLPGTLPTGATEPVAELNTLADILAACVNTTGGAAGDNTACGKLFTLSAPPSGTAPTDTIAAALDIARNPSHNASALLNLTGSISPFQPTLTAVNDFTVSIKYAAAGNFSKPSAAALNPAGDLWVTNAGNNTLTRLNATSGAATIAAGTTLNNPSGIAFTSGGAAWITNKAGNSLSYFDASATERLTYTGTAPTLSAPSAIAIDGTGKLWVTNSGNNSVTAVTVSGGNYSSSASYTGAGLSIPSAVAINPH